MNPISPKAAAIPTFDAIEAKAANANMTRVNPCQLSLMFFRFAFDTISNALANI